MVAGSDTARNRPQAMCKTGSGVCVSVFRSHCLSSCVGVRPRGGRTGRDGSDGIHTTRTQWVRMHTPGARRAHLDAHSDDGGAPCEPPLLRQPGPHHAQRQPVVPAPAERLDPAVRPPGEQDVGGGAGHGAGRLHVHGQRRGRCAALVVVHGGLAAGLRV